MRTSSLDISLEIVGMEKHTADTLPFFETAGYGIFGFNYQAMKSGLNNPF
ncbi:hypothetical protein GCM10007096_24310 [Pullulanibacillus pueri]|uniref:Uncharacterized protein n=1 Tax=Pullulanibacillus pueri TaxID=1437324 RepID=A0A8J2ZXE4_9BACL|nr:hypothetical protein GCM10007096_24310 [Pullulanibacillus pueri]